MVDRAALKYGKEPSTLATKKHCLFPLVAIRFKWVLVPLANGNFDRFKRVCP